jgi:hypothetical protein
VVNRGWVEGTMVAPIVLDVRLPGALESAELTRECACLAARLRASAVTAVVLDAGSLSGDLAAVQALARLSLVARHGGARVTVRSMSAELSSLVDWLGMTALFPSYDGEVRG